MRAHALHLLSGLVSLRCHFTCLLVSRAAIGGMPWRWALLLLGAVLVPPRPHEGEREKT